MKMNARLLLSSIGVSVGVGLLAGILTANSMEVYQGLVKPPFSPPGFVFPIVWSILYVLMGISAYRISISESPLRERALRIYGIQLFLNFSWTIVFFLLGKPLLAFVVLVLLWLTILRMIQEFSRIDPLAAKLQIPYLLWVTFAGYLNLAIYLLNTGVHFPIQ